uniref:Transmembrane protein n=1 Tax=Craspedostauros australis TaxID=1486917 RepID=A0A6T6EA47_9STRA
MCMPSQMFKRCSFRRMSTAERRMPAAAITMSNGKKPKSTSFVRVLQSQRMGSSCCICTCNVQHLTQKSQSHISTMIRSSNNGKFSIACLFLCFFFVFTVLHMRHRAHAKHAV